MKIFILMVLLFKIHAVSFAAIFGQDDRKSYYEVQDPEVQKKFSSIAGKFFADSLTKTSNGYKVGILPNRFQCASDKFYGETPGARCTGFLISEDLLVTAAHCMMSEADCTDQVWIFDYTKKSTSDGTYSKNIEKDRVYKCKKVEKRNINFFSNLDYAILRLDRKVEGREPLQLDFETTYEKSTPLFTIGHPSGLPLKFTDQSVILHEPNPLEPAFLTELDTFNGNSGGPVFDAKTNLVIGIVSEGYGGPVLNSSKTCKTVRVCDENHPCSNQVSVSKIVNLKSDLESLTQDSK